MEGTSNAKATSSVPKKPRTASFYRVIKVFSPLPYLAKARDFYIRSMTQCAGRANYSGLAAGALGVSTITLPKSFSTSSLTYDDEFGELVRAASQSNKSSPVAQEKEIPRSFSTNGAPSVGRIDEDSPCYFGGSFRKNAAQPDLRYPRARSCRPARISRVREEIVECA
ncbi:hypothetical protein SUGI_0558650 [Cryptomeria japonica]|uniref:uncharacterized protein LOC131075531 n=1 Tax=Cryptomeria japonica TaxID=3369 RepID=UPI002408D981|nr:uncharacterized protein LOC131075531 [Cryptomeria japonica]GLJ28386.1 hypothetical protein SUGI_0558650 [Cryptomeria japonica]